MFPFLVAGSSVVGDCGDCELLIMKICRLIGNRWRCLVMVVEHRSRVVMRQVVMMVIGNRSCYRELEIGAVREQAREGLQQRV